MQTYDVVEMEIDELGVLSNTMEMEETEWSILGRKKGGEGIRNKE